MKMKRIYSSPELEIIELNILQDVLGPSDPEPTTPTQGGVADPDPFGFGT